MIGDVTSGRTSRGLYFIKMSRERRRTFHTITRGTIVILPAEMEIDLVLVPWLGPCGFEESERGASTLQVSILTDTLSLAVVAVVSECTGTLSETSEVAAQAVAPLSSKVTSQARFTCVLSSWWSSDGEQPSAPPDFTVSS